MKIVHSVFRYLPVSGGATRLVQLLAEGAAARGHDVTVVTQEEPGAPSEETIAGVRVLRVPIRRVGKFRLPRGYRALLHRLDADVFQLNGNRIWNADFYLPYARSFDWPQAIMPMGFYHYWMRRGLLRWFYYDRYFAGRIRAFGRYLALTGAEREQVVGWGYPPERARVLPVGVDLEEFARSPADPAALRSAWRLPVRQVAVYAGGLYDNKRVDRLVRAVAGTRGEWGLVVLGPDVPGHPYDRAHCEALARELGAPVRFLGAVPRTELVTSFFAADAYVQASAFEGFGITLVEAMATGRPFVAFDAGVARDVAARGAGVVVSSEEEMSRALVDLPRRARERGSAARLVAQDYSVAQMVDRALEQYRAIARN